MRQTRYCPVSVLKVQDLQVHMQSTTVDRSGRVPFHVSRRKVAFGTITQLVLENVPQEELEEVIDFCIEVGLPVTWKELGAEHITDEQIMEVAKAACAENDTLHNMPFEVTPETVAAALKAADAYGRYYLGEE